MSLKKVIKNVLLRVKTVLMSQNEIVGDIDIHKDSLVEGSALTGNIKIGEGCKLHHVSISGNVIIGRFTSLWGPNISLNGCINIGSFCSIGKNVVIQEFNHISSRITTYYMFKNLFKMDKGETTSNGTITVGSDVWIGANSTILSGTTIGHGAIIGANSLINNDVPNYAIVAGIPAKVIRYRFPNEVIDLLEEIKWWEWSLEKLKKNKFLFEEDLTLKHLQSINEVD